MAEPTSPQGGQGKKYTPEELVGTLGPGSFIKYSDMTLWDTPGEGGPDLYIYAPAVTEDELMALEEQGQGQPATPASKPAAAPPPPVQPPTPEV